MAPASNTSFIIRPTGSVFAAERWVGKAHAKVAAADHRLIIDLTIAAVLRPTSLDEISAGEHVRNKTEKMHTRVSTYTIAIAP